MWPRPESMGLRAWPRPESVASECCHVSGGASGPRWFGQLGAQWHFQRRTCGHLRGYREWIAITESALGVCVAWCAWGEEGTRGWREWERCGLVRASWGGGGQREGGGEDLVLGENDLDGGVGDDPAVAAADSAATGDQTAPASGGGGGGGESAAAAADIAPAAAPGESF